MDLDLTETQEAVRDTFARLFESESTPPRVRAAEGDGWDRELWSHLVATGAPSLALPEQLGGGGGDLLDLSLVVEEQGRALGSAPLVETAVALRTLARAGADDLVGRILDDARPVAYGLRPAHGGVVELVPAGALTSDVVALDGDELAVASPPGSGRAPRRRATLDAAALADRDLRGRDGATRHVVARGAGAHELWTRGVDEWKALTAAMLVGAGAAACELAVDYVRDRHQFGAPIGSFQAVAHRLADVALDLEGARMLVRRSAWTADHDADRLGTAAAMAFAKAAEAAQRAVSESLHFHGGYGFMLEYDVQLYFRRVKAWALVLGDPIEQYRLVGASLGASGID